jgi:hypothetical protein
MINDIKQAIADKLKALYPINHLYAEDVPQDFKKPSFMITLADQDYNKRLSNQYQSLLTFDVSYFSNKLKTEIKEDCQAVQMVLFRSFDLVGGYRIKSKQAGTVDNVLHFTFNIEVSEMLKEDYIKMQKQQTNTNI